MKNLGPGSCCFVFMAVFVWRASCRTVFSLEMGSCKVNFNAYTLRSFQRCLTSENARACTVPVKYSYLSLTNRARYSVLSEQDNNTLTTSDAYFLCLATCKEQVYLYSASSLQCTRQQSGSQNVRCANKTTYYLTLMAQEYEGHSTKLVKVIEDIPGRKEAQMVGTFQARVCENNTVFAQNSSNPTKNTTQHSENSTSIDAGLVVAESLPGSGSNFAFLTLLFLVLPLISVVVWLKRRSRKQHTQNAQTTTRNIYLTPSDVVYSTHELGRRLKGSCDDTLGNAYSDSLTSIDNEDKGNFYSTGMDFSVTLYDSIANEYVNYPETRYASPSSGSETQHLIESRIESVNVSPVNDEPYSTIDYQTHSECGDALYSIIRDTESTTNM